MNIVFSQTGTNFGPRENVWLSESDLQKMKLKILADFDLEFSDNETTETSFNFTIENARKYQISGSCIADGQK